MIVTKNLQKSFHGNKVLCGIDEHIEKGEKVVVIGPSGSGKSTFLRCLNLLEEPTGGEVWFEGNNITSKDCEQTETEDGHGIPAVQSVSAFIDKGEYHACTGEAWCDDKGRGGEESKRIVAACGTT